jgi:hypothetical protein
VYVSPATGFWQKPPKQTWPYKQFRTADSYPPRPLHPVALFLSPSFNSTFPGHIRDESASPSIHLVVVVAVAIALPSALVFFSYSIRSPRRGDCVLSQTETALGRLLTTRFSPLPKQTNGKRAFWHHPVLTEPQPAPNLTKPSSLHRLHTSTARSLAGLLLLQQAVSGLCQANCRVSVASMS